MTSAKRSSTRKWWRPQGPTTAGPVTTGEFEFRHLLDSVQQPAAQQRRAPGDSTDFSQDPPRHGQSGLPDVLPVERERVWPPTFAAEIDPSPSNRVEEASERGAASPAGEVEALLRWAPVSPPQVASPEPAISASLAQLANVDKLTEHAVREEPGPTVAVPIVRSRFADAGLQDDRLPVGRPRGTRRGLRR